LEGGREGFQHHASWQRVCKLLNQPRPNTNEFRNRKFQDILKKYGYKYDRGKNRLVKLDGSAAPVTSTKETTGDKRTAEKFVTKKRKLKIKTDESNDEAA
jgi:hypothetical protein